MKRIILTGCYYIQHDVICEICEKVANEEVRDEDEARELIDNVIDNVLSYYENYWSIASYYFTTPADFDFYDFIDMLNEDVMNFIEIEDEDEEEDEEEDEINA